MGEGDLGGLVVQRPPWGCAEARIRAPGLFLHVLGSGTPDSPRCAVAAREPAESREQLALWWWRRRQHRAKEGTHDFLLTSLMPLHLTWQVCREGTVCESIWRGSVTRQRAGLRP